MKAFGQLLKYIIGGFLGLIGTIMLIASFTQEIFKIQPVIIGLVMLCISVSLWILGGKIIRKARGDEPENSKDTRFFKGSIPQGLVLMVIGVICLGITYLGGESHLIIRGTDEMVSGGISYGWFGLIFGFLRMVFRLSPQQD